MIFLSKKFNFIDKPNSRKIHRISVVNTSGILIYSFLLFLVLKYEFLKQIENIVIAGLPVAVMGFIDDRIDLKPSLKIIFLSLPSGYLIFNGLELTDLGTYEHIGKIELGKLSIIFTFLAVLLLINSINYLDGIDGLLIGYTIIALLYFYFLILKHNHSYSILLIFIYILSISLIFNFLKIGNVFKSLLGDAGSLFIGFFISFILIFLYKYHNIHPAFLIWACWIPIYDFLHVTFDRFKNKINVSKPDKSHFHHYVLNYFLNDQIKTFIFIITLNVCVIFSGYLICLFFGKLYSIISFTILFLIFIKLKLKFKNSTNG
tara:strand:- start:1331 stop:2284 length:954 start_codon:yes stop_codon:yes gene_type:complete